MRELTQHYHTLTVDERFRLFMSAAARHDYQELDRVNDTCPRETYRMENYEYLRNKVTFVTLAYVHHYEIVELAARCAALLAISFASTVSKKAAQAQENALGAIGELAALRRAKIEAWRRFCAELGIEPEQAREACGLGPDPVVQAVANVCSTLVFEDEIDESVVLQSLDALRNGWRGEPAT